MEPSYTDHELVKAFNEGDTKAFKLLYNDFYGPLCYFAKQLVRNEEEAKDIVMNTFTKLWERRANFNNIVDIRAFLYITVRNAGLNYIRFINTRDRARDKWQGELEISEFSIETKLIESDLLQMIVDEIKRLPGKMRPIAEMSIIHDYTTEEIASHLHLAPSTIRVQKANALRRIKTAFLKRAVESVTPFLVVFQGLFQL